jgi:phenylacetate-coenzyme A ligase PaaK-like adenylate-forming protein
LDLSELHLHCRTGDADAIRLELDRLTRGATGQRSSRQIADVEIAYNKRDAVLAWREWRVRAALPPKQGLRQLLEHARVAVPFYRRRLTGKSRLQLADFEPVSRAEMVSDPGSFLSEAQAISPRDAIHPTSGTTGKPLVVWIAPVMFYDMCYAVYQNVAHLVPEIWKRIQPDKCSVAQLSEHPMTWAGATCMLPLKMSVFRRIMFDSSSHEANLILGQLDPAIISGTPSTLMAFAEQLLPNTPTPRPLATLVSGERLHDDQRAAIERIYGGRCLNAYISSEGGVLALEGPHGSQRGLIARSHAVRLEVLTPDGGISDSGEGELLVTNLLNDTMPFIRYRSGDFARLETNARNGEQALLDLRGKEVAGYPIGQYFVPASAIEAALFEMGIEDFSLDRQTSQAFTLTYRSSASSPQAEVIASRLSGLLANATIDTAMADRVSQPGRKTLRFSGAGP